MKSIPNYCGKILILTCFVLSSPTWGAAPSNTSEAGQKFDRMEFVLFYNANHLPKGMSTYKVDRDQKKVQYFDADGHLREERVLDMQKNIVSKKFNPQGDLVSETVVTEQDVNRSGQESQKYGKEVVEPKVQALIQKLAQAAENYAKKHSGQYPVNMTDLTKSAPAYLDTCECDQNKDMYYIRCNLKEDGYTFIAHSIWSHKESFVISTGGQLQTKKPGELGPGLPYIKSESPCQ